MSIEDRVGGRMPSGKHSRGPVMTRRGLLGTGAAAIAAVGLSEGRAGAAVADVVHSPGDGDASGALQEAIDACAMAGGGEVQLAAGTFYIGTTLRARSNVTIRGSGMGMTVLRDAAGLGVNPIITAFGTSRTPIHNVMLSDLTIRNGDALTGRWLRGEKRGAYYLTKDGFVIDGTSQVTIRRVQITEIAGAGGFRVFHSSHVMVDQCHFYRCTYAMMFVDPDNQHITVQDSVFDTLTSRAYPNTYTFATVKRAGDAFARDILIQRNKFLNNPLWEGVDSHGARDLTIRNNRIENCRYGISLQAVAGYVTDADTSNTLIENNTIIQGDALNLPGGVGVVKSCHGGPSSGLQIIGNRITGFGGTTELSGAIELYDRCDGTVIEDNVIDGYGINAIALFYGTFGTVIRNNTFGDVGRRKDGTFSAAIASTDTGNYGITVTGNTLQPTTPAGAPDYFVYTAGGNGSWQISGNSIGTVLQDTPYGGVDHLPVDKDAVEQMGALQQAGGDIVYGSDDRPHWRVVWPRTGYGAAVPAPVLLTVAMVAGSPVAKIVADGSGSWMDLPPGMNVVIAGAGEGGSDLLARVVSNNATAKTPATEVRVILDRPAEADVTSAAVTMQRLRIAPLRPSVVA